MCTTNLERATGGESVRAWPHTLARPAAALGVRQAGARVLLLALAGRVHEPHHGQQGGQRGPTGRELGLDVLAEGQQG